jgi:Tfp pilus assembly protein PilF
MWLALWLSMSTAAFAQAPPQKPESSSQQGDRVAALRARLEKSPDDAGARFELGQALLFKRNYLEASAEFRRCVQIDPREIGCHRALGEALRDAGDLPASISAYREAILANPTLLPLHYDLFQSLIFVGDFDGLDEAMRFAAQVLPVDEVFLRSFGIWFYLKGPASQAEQEFLRLAKRAANPAKAHRMMCGALQDLLVLGSAQQECRRAAALAGTDPQFAKVLESLQARFAAEAQKLADIRAHAASGKLTGDEWGMYLLWLYMNADFRDALAVVPAWLRTRPDDSENLFILVPALMLRMGKEKAISQLESWGRDPELSFALIALAIFQERSGDLSGAGARLRDAVRRDPKRIAAHQALARVLEKLGENVAAEAEAKLAEQLEESKPGAIEMNEASALGSLRTLNTVCVTYSVTYGGFPPDLQSLGGAPGGGAPSERAADLIDSMLANARKRGYLFEYLPLLRDAKGNIVTYEIHADPVEPGITGNRFFFTDESGVVRANIGSRASAASPPI